MPSNIKIVVGCEILKTIPFVVLLTARQSYPFVSECAAGYHLHIICLLVLKVHCASTVDCRLRIVYLSSLNYRT